MAAKITVQEIIQHGKDIDFAIRLIEAEASKLKAAKDEEGYTLSSTANRLRRFVNQLTEAEITLKG